LKISGVIYRLGRKPDPWAVPDWASAGPDGTFGNRFDDPDATYRVLYASSQRLGCFFETLARFRVDPKLLTELAEIAGEDDYWPLGEVPLEWAGKRVMGAATANGDYADICSSEWISRLRKLLAIHLEKFGFGRLRRVRFAADSAADPDAVRITHRFPMTTLQESTTAPNMDTIFLGLNGLETLYFYLKGFEKGPVLKDLQQALLLHGLKFKK